MEESVERGGQEGGERGEKGRLGCGRIGRRGSCALASNFGCWLALLLALDRGSILSGASLWKRVCLQEGGDIGLQL